MFEIIMLLAFLYAATCQFLPGTDRDDKPGLLRKKRVGGKAREPADGSAELQRRCRNTPDRRGNRKPALHVQHDRHGIAMQATVRPG